ncbi:hypothetical protein WAI453_000143 [Rhynchosporium graminicola]
MSDQMLVPDGRSPTDIIKPVCVEELPNEVLHQIFGYLVTQPPSSRLGALRDEPNFNITKSEEKTLKAISVTSRRWRAMIIPTLFKHSQFIVRGDSSLDSRLSQKMKPFFNFITSNSLYTIMSFALIVYDREVTNKPFGGPRCNDFAEFWYLLFQVINPTDLLIVAPPEALGRLTDCRVNLIDEKSFDCECQYLRLQMRSESPQIGAYSWGGWEKILNENGAEIEGAFIDPITGVRISSTERTSSFALFSIRPWENLLLNEGSFIKVYLEPDHDRKRFPSILPDLVGLGHSNHALASSTIRDMSYIAMFPVSSHFFVLVNNLPRLDRLYTQIVPQNKMLKDIHKMKNLRQDVLWIERNGCYAWLMQKIFSTPTLGNYPLLKILESGDQADRESWEPAAHFIHRRRQGWVIAGDGVLVKNPEAAPPTNPVMQNMYDENPIAFNYSLVRWAWNGTANLPVSTQPMYRYGRWT